MGTATSPGRGRRGVRSERQLLVGRALEREAVQRRDAEALDRGPVVGCRVSDVRAEVPARVQDVGAVHEAVPGDLGDDRRPGDGGTARVAVDDGPLLVAYVPDAKAIDEADGPGHGDAQQRVAQCREVRAM